MVLKSMRGAVLSCALLLEAKATPSLRALRFRFRKSPGLKGLKEAMMLLSSCSV